MILVYRLQRPLKYFNELKHVYSCYLRLALLSQSDIMFTMTPTLVYTRSLRYITAISII